MLEKLFEILTGYNSRPNATEVKTFAEYLARSPMALQKELLAILANLSSEERKQFPQLITINSLIKDSDGQVLFDEDGKFPPQAEILGQIVELNKEAAPPFVKFYDDEGNLKQLELKQDEKGGWLDKATDVELKFEEGYVKKEIDSLKEICDYLEKIASSLASKSLSISELIVKKDIDGILKNFSKVTEEDIPLLYSLFYYESNAAGQKKYGTFLHRAVAKLSDADFKEVISEFVKLPNFADYLLLQNESGKNVFDICDGIAAYANKKELLRIYKPTRAIRVGAVHDGGINTHQQSIHKTVDQSWIRLTQAFTAEFGIGSKVTPDNPYKIEISDRAKFNEVINS
jgi:hypothetical protein